jgi:O-Antigen ligase
MTSTSPPVQQGIRAWLGNVLLVAIALTVLAYGSASPAQSNIAALAFAVLAMLTSFLPIGAWRVGRVRTAAVLLIGGLMAYAALQSLPLPGMGLANGAWKSVSETIGPVRGTISVAPGMTLDALPSLALPFLAFVSALVLFQGDEEGLRLWRALAYFGAAYAAFGILQEALFPQQILLEHKTHYLENLTATFVNRNTAGTFFGIALVLNLGLAFHEVRKVRVAAFARRALDFDIGWRDKYGRALIHALLCLVVAIALFLTQSRGAVGASFIACLAATVLMTARRLTADSANEDFAKWRRYAALGVGVLAIAGLFALFAGRSVYRMEEQGTDDARWCAFASTIEAIKDNWIFGAGFGAFQDVFPVYRHADCVGIFGVWERAHNVFLEGYLGLGLPFLGAMAVGYFVLIGVFVRGVRARHKFRFVPVMGLAALLLASLHSLVDFSLQIPGFGVYFGATMAAAATVSLGRSRE